MILKIGDIVNFENGDTGEVVQVDPTRDYPYGVKRADGVILWVYGEIIEARTSDVNRFKVGDRVWVQSEHAHAEVVTIGVDSYTVKLDTLNAPTIEVNAAQLARGGIPF